ncbi:MAG: ribbon-helix-helix protein, CopG family [Nocardioidaceae bacterium]
MRGSLTVNLDEAVVRALHQAAAREGVPEGELVEDALRRWFGLRGLGVLDDLAERQSGADGPDDEAALSLALQEVRAARAARRRGSR